MDPEPGVAAFDFDGTLVKGDSFRDFWPTFSAAGASASSC